MNANQMFLNEETPWYFKMKELRELLKLAKSKVKRLEFIVEEGTVFDRIRVMAIKLGKHNRVSTYLRENDFEIRFYSLSEFFKNVDYIDGIGIKADIRLGENSYSKQYFYHALKIVKDPEIGLSNMVYPLIIRNDKCSVFIAPKIPAEKINIRDLVDIVIDDLNLVERLDFMRGTLTTIPDGIRQCKNLKKLHLGFNPLTHLNDALKEINALEELYLQCTSLVSLPEWIGEFENLKILKLAVTPLKVLPESIKNLTSLEILDLEYVELININEIPELINPDNLRELNLCSTRFTEISSLKRFKNLEVLGIAGNEIKDIKDLKYLKNLRELNISGNKYSNMEGLENLTKLEYLDMDLREIEGLQNLENLHTLKINYSEKDRPLLDNLGGIWEDEHYDEVMYPQKIVEYCRKKQFDINEFKDELDLGGLSEISVIVLEERVNKGDEIAKKILFLNEMKQK